MKINKASFTVTGIKPTRERCLEGEAEGRLAKGLVLLATLPIAKIKHLFTDAGSYARKVEAHYDDKGQLLDEDGGEFKLNTEGRACKATLEYALTETHEFEDSGLDSIKITLEQGRVVTLKCRLLLHPTVKQLAKVDQWLKNEVKLTLNGETILASEEAEEEEETGQRRMPLGGGETAGHGQVSEGDEDRPSLAASLAEFDKSEGRPELAADLGANNRSVEDLRAAGVLAPPKDGVKPSLAHGEPAIPGGKPPQRARRKPPTSETLQ